jgi:hypothetical protein
VSLHVQEQGLKVLPPSPNLPRPLLTLLRLLEHLYMFLVRPVSGQQLAQRSVDDNPIGFPLRHKVENPTVVL